MALKGLYMSEFAPEQSNETILAAAGEDIRVTPILIGTTTAMSHYDLARGLSTDDQKQAANAYDALWFQGINRVLHRLAW